MTRERRAVRGLLLTPDAKVLLMRFLPPWLGEEMWITPGGGIRRGESTQQALVRELHEETGLAVSDVGRLVWRRAHLWDHVDPPLLQREQYFLLPCARFAPRTDGLREGGERDWFGGFHWWPIHELPEHGAKFAPTRLGALLRQLVRDGAGSDPVEVGT